ncbi:serine/threonine-protein kinase [Amnibacterium kyonggiense]|uniref:serine/threonine-protein kinase n=1 Tax=Amnibacterium kyonggiense TaxID=595671 RepID=UPI0013C34D1B|nr:serine/threonine-protein kinase [Amnibacterium kyonggiense]
MAEREPGPGDVLAGRYELLAELGRGGMATVFSGMDLRLQRRVAIKVFRGGFAEAVDPQRTTQEMRLLAAVNHPSVVAVLDASNGDGVFGAFLVMELVVGDDLGALLHRARGPLAADFARRIVADVASALAALHERGVVHRDVKPANILVPRAASSGASGVAAKLTDFGIAQLVDGARLTAPDSILGTAAYLSPEQVKGAPPRPASDVYSLGLVLLEALTGKRAFPGPAAEAAMARLQRPPALPEDASPALADLLSRMTALDPAHRPPAADVAAALRELLVGRVTAPDATQTAPTPVAGMAAFAAPRASDATQLHEPLFTPSRGMPISGPVAVARPARRRFPAVLAVAAAALAAAVTGVAISAASNVSTTNTAEQQRSTASSAPKDAGARAQQQVAAGADEDAGVVKAVPKPVSKPTTPKPSPSATTPTPTPTGGATSTTPVEPSGTPTSSTPSSPPPTEVAPVPSDTPTTGEGASSDPTPPDGQPIVQLPLADGAEN